jgi:dTDP-D-glucose 4,6-dehydratase
MKKKLLITSGAWFIGSHLVKRFVNEYSHDQIVNLRKLGREAFHSAQLITFVTDRAGHDLRYGIDSSKLQRH